MEQKETKKDFFPAFGITFNFRNVYDIKHSRPVNGKHLVPSSILTKNEFSTAFHTFFRNIGLSDMLMCIFDCHSIFCGLNNIRFYLLLSFPKNLYLPFNHRFLLTCSWDFSTFFILLFPLCNAISSSHTVFPLYWISHLEFRIQNVHKAKKICENIFYRMKGQLNSPAFHIHMKYWKRVNSVHIDIEKKLASDLLEKNENDNNKNQEKWNVHNISNGWLANEQKKKNNRKSAKNCKLQEVMI